MSRQEWVQLTGVVLRLAALVIIFRVAVGVPGVNRLARRLRPVRHPGRRPVRRARLAPLPAAVFTFAAGALFGVADGLVVVEAGASVGAVMTVFPRLRGARVVLRIVRNVLRRSVFGSRW